MFRKICVTAVTLRKWPRHKECMSYFFLQKNLRQTVPCKYYSSDKPPKAVEGLVTEKPASLEERQLDEATQQKLQKFRLELDLLFQNGRYVCHPSSMTWKDWQHVLTLHTVRARTRYYDYAMQKKAAKEKESEKKEQQQLLGKIIKQNVLDERKANKHINYGLGNTAMIIRIHPRKIDAWRNSRLLRAKQFGLKLIFDCSFENVMRFQDSRNIAEQLIRSFGINRLHREPFDMHICNANWNGDIMKSLQKNNPKITAPSFPLEVNEANYVDMFPRDQLVCLTPHSRNVIETFNHKDIHIISGLFEQNCHTPVAMCKAKEQGIRTAWFPIDRFLDWEGPMALPLNIITSILLDFKETGDWNYAFRHIPKRKIKQSSPDGDRKKNSES